MRKIKTILLLAFYGLKSRVIYKTELFLNPLAFLLTQISYIITTYVLFSSVDSIGVWSYEYIMIFYGMLLIVTSISQTLFDNIWQLQRYLYSGDFMKYCLKPINIFAFFCLEVIDIKGIIQFGMGTIIVFESIKKIKLIINAAWIVKTIISIVGGMLGYFGVIMALSSIMFYCFNASILLEFFFKIKDYARYPLSIYSNFIKVIFTFVIPLGVLSYYPSLALFDARGWEYAISTFVFGCVYAYIGYFLWMRGAMKYAGTGN